MASARPSAVLRLSAKIDTSVVNVTSRNTDIEPTTASAPRAIGNAAASSPPNTQTSTRKLSGSAISFHQQQVVLVLLVDLGVLHRRATGADGDAVTIVDEFVRQGLGVFLRVVFAAFEVDHDQPRLAVGADQIGGGLRWRGPGRGHVVHQRRPLQIARRGRCPPCGPVRCWRPRAPSPGSASADRSARTCRSASGSRGPTPSSDLENPRGTGSWRRGCRRPQRR